MDRVVSLEKIPAACKWPWREFDREAALVVLVGPADLPKSEGVQCGTGGVFVRYENEDKVCVSRLVRGGGIVGCRASTGKDGGRPHAVQRRAYGKADVGERRLGRNYRQFYSALPARRGR